MIHYIFNNWSYILFWFLTGALIVQPIFLYKIFMRAGRRLIHYFFPTTIPAWKIAMSVHRPSGGRPRFLSIHTLAALTGRDDLLQLAKEMKNSCEVNGSYCTSVRSPVFYLKHISQLHQKEIWRLVEDSIKKHPYPAVKGFQFATGLWSGGEYGKGTYTAVDNAMADPFIKDDYCYANLIIDALRDAGYEPGIKKYKIDKSTPRW